MNNHSQPEIKIALFRSLFKGREDIYARRFENSKIGTFGYQPVCRNEWIKGICEKPKIKCGNCGQRLFEAVTGETIRNHLTGFTPAKNGWKKQQGRKTTAGSLRYCVIVFCALPLLQIPNFTVHRK